ncbi:BLUF domain-containing protein [uncultured Friedmanniella sp.]|uniref:BLUF domain-containing protein n=1 Tax=uncultured Friedmanniella sp. TaxID=335381 RepID=UPI0035CC3E20
MPYFVAYVSSASQLLTTEQLEELLVTSRRNNEARGLTGALLYQDGNFIQVLEGEQSVVEDLYNRIAIDPRHRQVIVLVRGTTAERQFGEWSMAYSDLSGSLSALAEESRLLHADGDSDGADGAGVGRRLLLSFRRTLDNRSR